MFLLMVALVAAGIGLLFQRKIIQEEIKKLNAGGQAKRGNNQYQQVPQSNHDGYGNEVFNNQTAANQFQNNSQFQNSNF